MRSLRNLGDERAGTPLLADDVLEFHGARILLLIRLCGTANRIDGLTKMAKLDFFVRYPQFFKEIARKLGDTTKPSTMAIESSMVRFHYGPWDKRYYHILSYLEAKKLITVTQQGKQVQLRLTALGKDTADRISKERSFAKLALHMKNVKRLLGKKSGSTLKKWIYEVFDQEVSRRSLEEVIE
jgi:DNA-binding PadR family transcriptional regulator